MNDGICYPLDDVVKVIALILQKNRLLKVNVPEPIVLLFGIMNDFFIPYEKRIIGFDKAKEMLQEFWLCRGSDIMKAIGWVPQYDLKRGMEETICWYQQNGYLKT